MFIVIGSVITLAIFLFVGWAVSAEMFQQRAWRRKVAAGDVDIIGALLGEAMGQWRRARPPKGIPGNRWAAIQGAELVAATPAGVTVSASVVPEYHTESGRRIKLTREADEAGEIAVRLIDRIMYDVPNLYLSRVRVDVYASLGESDAQLPVLSTTATRAEADALDWEALSPSEILARFDTIGPVEREGEVAAIELPPVEGQRPRPADIAALDASFDTPRRTS